MSHPQADRLVLAALGEAPLDEAEAGHVDACDSCRHELRSLRAVAEVGRGTAGLSELPEPPQRVWNAIAEELALGESTVTTLPARSDSPPTPISPSAPARTGRRAWAIAALAAAAAAIIAVVATVVVFRQLEPAPLACAGPPAELDALPGTPAGAHGTACVTGGDDRTLRVEATGMPTPGNAVYTVWLIDPSSLSEPDGIRLQALGNMADAPEADFPVPATIDLARYSVVDISREPNDGDAAHSGDSLLRGQLQ